MTKILIIEDEALLNEAYATLLQKEGYEVARAYNGVEGLDCFKKSVPDLVLLDLRMPKMDGIEFLKKLQPSKNYPKLKIVVFSNYEEPSETEAAFKLGAHRYMLKAWASPRELIQIIADTLKSKTTK